MSTFTFLEDILLFSSKRTPCFLFENGQSKYIEKKSFQGATAIFVGFRIANRLIKLSKIRESMSQLNIQTDIKAKVITTIKRLNQQH